MADKSKDMVFGSECKGSVGGTVMLLVAAGLKASYEWTEPADNGMIGTDKPANTGRLISVKDVKGGITVWPSYAHANSLLGLCFDESTGTFTPADDPGALDVDVVLDRGVDVYTYENCWLNTLTISGAEKERLSWALDLLGQDETDAGSVAALVIPDTMRFCDLTLSLASNNYFCTAFSWMFSYDVEERFHHSLTRSSIAARIPFIDLGITFDVNSDTFADLFALAGTDTAIEDVNLVFTDGVNTVSLLHPEMTVMNSERFQDIGEVSSQSLELKLRAWLASLEDDIFTATYA